MSELEREREREREGGRREGGGGHDGNRALERGSHGTH